ncbi:MAG TPA: WGR domain-containing protein [Polyangia bacterium]|jgi:uncharacterized protein (TIGR02996 family)
MPRYEFSEGSSNKFWEIALEGKAFTTTWGRIGTAGQTKTKTCASEAAAKKEYDKLIAEKVGKGYVEAGGKADADGDEDDAPAGGNARVVGARNPELERAILADPDDEAAYQVYADWLQGEGDPRGELAALQVALAGGEARELRAREQALIEANREQLLGDLPDVKPDDDGAPLKITWHAGWLRSARIAASEEQALPDLYRSLLACASARFLRELTFGVAILDDMNDYRDTNAVIAELGLPPAVRKLHFANPAYEESMISSSDLGDVGVWLRGASGLRELTLEGGSMQLGAIDLPALRSFSVITGGFTTQNIRDVTQAGWPKLETLSLYFGDDNYGASGGAEDVRPILEGRGLPALRELGLCNSEFADELAGLLGKSPVLRQLRVLDLSKGTLSDEGARALLASAPAFAHLERIDLTENFLSAEMVQAVEKLCPDVRAGDQRDGDEDDRYVAVGE